MKKPILILLALGALILSLGAIDDKYLYQLAHVKSNPAMNVDTSEGQVITRNQNQIWIHSIFNPWSPRIESSFYSVAQIEDINVLGEVHLYICTREPANVIVPVDSLNSYGKIYFINHLPGDKITREGSMLYVADRFKGIDIINIGTGGLREVISTFSEKWGIRDFIAQYPYIYALNDFGLVTVDMTDQQFPISLGTNYQLYDAKVMAKNGDVIWVGAGKDLLGINIRDLNKPIVVTQFRLSNDILDLEVQNDRLFIALGKGGVKILDIKNPLRINDINAISTNMTVYDIALDKEYIFLALGRDGWMIYEYR
jgi:hypothetical protein